MHHSVTSGLTGRGESKAKVTAANCQWHNAPEVLLWGREEVQLVERWNTRDEHRRQSTSSGGSRLHDIVLSRSKIAAQNREPLRQDPREELQDCKTNDG